MGSPTPDLFPPPAPWTSAVTSSMALGCFLMNVCADSYTRSSAKEMAEGLL